MAQVILFGGGDGGGLIITASGVRPIPPFEPALLLRIKGISKLVSGIRLMGGKHSQETGVLVNRFSNLLLEEVEAVVGPIDGENAFVYQDEDGGFTCGSTGKPPVPFPWPPTEFPSFGDLIRTGVLDRELIDFVDEAIKRDINVLEALESPLDMAKRLGVTLSQKSAADLKRLAPSQLKTIQDPVNKEIVTFFHTVAKEGTYLESWAKKPYEVANKLNVKLSERAMDRLIAGNAGIVSTPGSAVMNPAVVVAVVVGVVIMLVPTEAGLGKFDIRDLSNVSKF